MKLLVCSLCAMLLLTSVPLQPALLKSPSAFSDPAPAVNNGLTWLLAHRNAANGWSDVEGSELRDTSIVLDVLYSRGQTGNEYSDGLFFLVNSAPANHDYLARQIASLAKWGIDVSSKLDRLLAGRSSPSSPCGGQPCGGWGIAPDYAADVLDTAVALRAFASAGRADESSIVQPAIAFLLAAQKPEGGWALDAGAGTSSVLFTTEALLALKDYAAYPDASEMIGRGVQWLRTQQNPDGSYGSTVYETALAVYTLDALGSSPDNLNGAISFLLNSQSDDGSWYGRAYDTALVVQALATRLLPSSFTKTAPQHAVTFVSNNTTLSWERSIGAKYYEYCYDATNDDICTGTWHRVGDATSAEIGNLASDTRYYWQVRASSSGGVAYADSGVWWSFTTTMNPPAPFGKIAPAKGVTDVSASLTLSWNASANAASYEYCYDTDAEDPCRGIWSGTGLTTSVQIDGLDTGAIYYWQVRAVNAGGTVYADNEWFDFITEQVSNHQVYLPLTSR